ncbi:hypothetical protein CDL15_Pgr006722 [Punica granatum]|uniref:Sialate O-acetylesterase domain-containing protein n=2 Tax=Punica granatum TaxID=22663 RepID=A0A218X8I9_PUNGR|nr:hypothetical protein CDL15_Pgr006722 [Punica granatum]PKI48059.1 hypothetical protein CRG98_031576 [Punica granatum]
MPEAPPKNIFLLAGQSNMSGRGGVKRDKTGYLAWDGVVPPECEPDPSISRLDANLTWELAKEPLHEGIDAKRINGVGPGMPFAHEILKLKPDYGTIGLVPCALAGSSIDRWQRGTALYDRLMLRANVSVQGGGKIQALLWQQGGSDSESIGDAIAYQPKLSKFFSDVREDLKSPDLIILQIAIAPGKKRFTSLVRSAQFTVEDPNIRTVDTEGMPVEWDHVHLTTQGQIQLGKILASRFLDPPSNQTFNLQGVTFFSPNFSPANSFILT